MGGKDSFVGVAEDGSAVSEKQQENIATHLFQESGCPLSSYCPLSSCWLNILAVVPRPLRTVPPCQSLLPSHCLAGLISFRVTRPFILPGSQAGGKYLPEIGYALRGGCDKKRLKSTPQFTGGGGRVIDTGAFVRNFQEGEVCAHSSQYYTIHPFMSLLRPRLTHDAVSYSLSAACVARPG